jgi:hypothetical protein
VAILFFRPPDAHPGIESTYVVEGEAELLIDGQTNRVVHAGDAFQVPPNTVHGVKIGDRNAKACSTLVVEKEGLLSFPLSPARPRSSIGPHWATGQLRTARARAPRITQPKRALISRSDKMIAANRTSAHR